MRQGQVPKRELGPAPAGSVWSGADNGPENKSVQMKVWGGVQRQEEEGEVRKAEGTIELSCCSLLGVRHPRQRVLCEQGMGPGIASWALLLKSE